MKCTIWLEFKHLKRFFLAILFFINIHFISHYDTKFIQSFWIIIIRFWIYYYQCKILATLSFFFFYFCYCFSIFIHLIWLKYARKIKYLSNRRHKYVLLLSIIPRRVKEKTRIPYNTCGTDTVRVMCALIDFECGSVMNSFTLFFRLSIQCLAVMC